MEQIEPLDAELADAGRPASASSTSERAALRAQIAEEEVAIEAELERVRAERAAIAGEVEPELLAEYETLRPQSGGIAIARLVGGSCGGCHLQPLGGGGRPHQEAPARGAGPLRGVRPPPRSLSVPCCSGSSGRRSSSSGPCSGARRPTTGWSPSGA